MDQEENHNTDKTTSSLKTLSSEMNAMVRKRQVKNMLCILLLSLSSLFLVLFFSLPLFQASSVHISGLDSFSREDILSLGDLSHYQLNLTLDEKKTEGNIVSSSQGLIRSADIKNNGLVSSLDIKEDHPIGYLDATLYFSSVKTKEEILSEVKTLPLDEKAKSRISTKVEENSTKTLPSIYFPEGVEENSDNVKKAFAPLSDLDMDVLSTFVGVQYRNENGDTNWSNVGEILIHDKDRYYLFSSLMMDRLDVYFSRKNYPGYLLSEIGKYLDNHQEETSSYSFVGKSEVYPVYRFKLVYKDSQDGNPTISILKEDNHE